MENKIYVLWANTSEGECWPVCFCGSGEKAWQMLRELKRLTFSEDADSEKLKEFVENAGTSYLEQYNAVEEYSVFEYPLL